MDVRAFTVKLLRLLRDLVTAHAVRLALHALPVIVWIAAILAAVCAAIAAFHASVRLLAALGIAGGVVALGIALVGAL